MENEYIPFETYSKIYKNPNGQEVGVIFDAVSGTKIWGIAGAGILITSPDLSEILLLKRSSKTAQGYHWSIPGGSRKKVGDVLEDALVTAVDETRDEIGRLPKGRIRKNPYRYRAPGTNFIYHTFILEIDPNEKESFIPELNWEHTEWGWFKRDSLDKILLHPGLKDFLENYSFEE